MTHEWDRDLVAIRRPIDIVRPERCYLTTRRELRRACLYSVVSLVAAAALMLATSLGSPTALGTMLYQMAVALLLLAPPIYFDFRSKRIRPNKNDDISPSLTPPQKDVRLYLLDLVLMLYMLHVLAITTSLL